MQFTKNSSRINNSIRNTIYALAGQFFAIVISFLSRMIFIQTLGSEYLGINGLFSNILSILSFAELGIGTAITYSLYKPLAQNDSYTVKALMHIYKRWYTYIGLFIALIGLIITPFLSFFIKDIPEIPHLELIFLMFVSNSAISYFFSYKRSLIIADQKRYITTIYRYSFYFVLNILQIAILVTTRDFIVFLTLQILSTLFENVLISKKANKLYPYIKELSNERLNLELKNSIKRNVKAMMSHKVGSIVVNGTNNLLLAKLFGVVVVGLYSNYLLIINALNIMFSMFFQGITASIGNLGVTESEDKSNFIFNCLNLMGFWIYGFSSISLFFLFNPFIELWLGDSYKLSTMVVSIIVINFFLTGMRKSVLTFRDALGLYWYDRHKPIFEALINIIVSLILAYQFGMIGIFIGTTISTLTTCFWVEPYILYKYGFNKSAKPYFKSYLIYILVILLAGGLTLSIKVALISNVGSGTYLIAMIMTCIIIPNSVFFIAFRKSEEFRYLSQIAFKLVRRRI